MTEFGKKYTKTVYYDLESILTINEVEQKIRRRILELKDQGFSSQQAGQIIFDSSDFINSFLDLKILELLRKKYYKP
jgi:hypothetical protein